MKLFVIAKLVLLISFVNPLWAYKNKDTFKCGLYEVRGVLKYVSRQKLFKIIMYPNSANHFELVVLGMNLKKKFLHINNYIKAKVYIPQAINNNKYTYAFLQSIDTATQYKKADPEKRFIQKAKCGDKRYYKE